MNLAAGLSHPVPRVWADGAIADGRRREKGRGRQHRRSPPRDGIRTRARNEVMNVLLVTTDQQRADTIGAYGSRLAATPNLDRLAAEGWRGPSMGFGDVDLILFGHHINPGADRPPEHWGPPPRGLHYARFLFRDGPEAGTRRLRSMTIEAAMRPSPAPETWASALPEEDHPTTYVAERTVDFLRRVDRTRPWFCWTSFTDPHHPMDPPAPWCDRY